MQYAKGIGITTEGKAPPCGAFFPFPKNRIIIRIFIQAVRILHMVFQEDGG